MGYTRKEIAEKLLIANNGNLSDNLKALIASDFIVRYVPFGYSGKQEHYKLVDPFCLFYLKFLKNADTWSEGFWEENVSSQKIVSWRGNAFENVCFNHVKQIKAALLIAGISSKESAWSPKAEDGKEGMQIDMLIDRADNVLNLCEIKYYTGSFQVDKQYFMTMLKRKKTLEEAVHAKKSVRNTLITTFGLAKNKYSDIFTNVVTLDDMFR